MLIFRRSFPGTKKGGELRLQRRRIGLRQRFRKNTNNDLIRKRGRDCRSGDLTCERYRLEVRKRRSVVKPS